MMMPGKSILQSGLLIILLTGSDHLLADDLVVDGLGWPKIEAPNPNWLCKYCPKSEPFYAEFSLNFGYLNRDNFRFGNLSGLDKGLNAYPEFFLSHIAPKGYHWTMSLDVQSIDSKVFNFRFFGRNNWQFSARYQDFPTRQDNKLYSPFSIKNKHQLLLPDNWQFLPNMQNLVADSQHNNLSLALDWQRLNLGLTLHGDLLNYKMNYQRITKSGTAAGSSAQIINAFYLPVPIEQHIDNLELSLSHANLWSSTTLTYWLSRFSNHRDSIRYELPYQSLSPAATSGQSALAPDNTAYKIAASLSLHKPGITLKAYLAIGEQMQDSPLLPYTVNNALAVALPIGAPKLKVVNKQFNLRYHWRLSPTWSLKAKYKVIDRDNRSPQWQFTPVYSDLYITEPLTNLGLDINVKKTSVTSKWRFSGSKSFSLQWQETNKSRYFKIKSRSHDQGFSARLNLPFNQYGQVNLRSERFTRSARQWQTIDLVDIKYHPILQKFTFADRKQSRWALSYALPLDAFSLQLGSDFRREHYKNSSLGLDKSTTKIVNLHLDWRLAPRTLFNTFVDWQSVEAKLNAGLSPASQAWSAASTDKVTSLGFNLSVSQLFEQPLALSLKFIKSKANSDMDIRSVLTFESLPRITSDWTSVVMELVFQVRQDWIIKASYQDDKFASADPSLDLSYPGAVSNLLTFGALSHNYKVNYVLLSLTHKF